MEEENVLYDYQSNNFYDRINSGLINGSLDEDLVDIVKNLDSAIGKRYISQETTLYRGFSSNDIIKNWNVIVSGKPYTFIDGAYISTSTEPGVAAGFARMNGSDGIFDYVKVKNVYAANIGKMTEMESVEAEILLEINLDCTITKEWESEEKNIKKWR